MMVGIPSDAEEKCIETARKFIELNPVLCKNLSNVSS